jgi:hypothetical protein
VTSLVRKNSKRVPGEFHKCLELLKVLGIHEIDVAVCVLFNAANLRRHANMGFDNVHVEPWEFGRGWELQKLTVEMIERRYQPLIGYAKGWSPATAGVIVASPDWLGNPKDDPKKYEGKLSGAIVMTRPILTDFIRADRAPASRQAYRRRTAVSISFTDELSRIIQSIENVENFADSCPFPKKEHSFGGVDECQCAVRPEYRGVRADHFPAAA